MDTASRKCSETLLEVSNIDQPVMQQEPDKEPPGHMYYTYEELQSRPYITADSQIPENLLYLSHSFGYDSGRRANLQVFDDRTLSLIAGNLLVLLDVPTKQQRYLRSCSGGGIGSVAVHPSREYFAVAEKGNRPNIIVYEFPSLRPHRILDGGAKLAYSFVDFSRDGKLLASVGSAPDFMLSLWDWRQEEVKLSCKAISQEVYRVTFSPHIPGQLTTSGSGHIKFWQMANSFTGLKLQGLLGRFGKTAVTDIEGYVELPDGKVVSGTDWGNLLLWEGDLIKVEICRKGGRTCHAGTARPFTLEEGQLMTIGSDGAVRGWDFESIDTADCKSDSGMFEMEPMNEMVIAHASLCSVVKSSLPDSFLWFAQDCSGSIWKLDLSFTNTTPDPECLFSFHAGPIQGMDVSRKSHLMATTALDRLVKVFDFVAKRELTSSRFTKGGTVLCWAPSLVSQTGGLLVTGFEDGVIRLLELYNPKSLHAVTWRSHKGDAELNLKQAFKPHNAPVTAIAYERNGEILATGSSDCTVFFFTVGEKYNPIGFIQVPGPVQGLEWSPHSHNENTLLILCQSGHVIEVQSPDPEAQNLNNTYHLSGLTCRYFRFRSIKSRIKRDWEIARLQAAKGKKKREEEEQVKPRKEQWEDSEMLVEEEEDQTLPPIYIPDPPSPLYCGFYSLSDQFWLTMGGFDAGYLYHCKFSEKQDEDPDQRQDEPFEFLPVHNADDDPICSVTFSSNRKMILCGMHSGSIRVYPLLSHDDSLTSMEAYWALSLHDNQYGHLRHIRCSHDDQFVLTAGDDGNIFSLCLIPPEELQKALQAKKAKVPSPRVGLDTENVAQDIEDSAAYSIEMAKQKLEKDQMRREAETKVAARRKRLTELQKRFKEVLDKNQSLPEHVCLQPAELQLDQQFGEQAEKVKAQRAKEVRNELAWEEERCCIALRQLQDQYFLTSGSVTVVAIRSDHRVTTYHLQAFTERSHSPAQQGQNSAPAPAAHLEHKKYRAEPLNENSKIQEEVPIPPPARAGAIKLADWQIERLRKAAEKAEQARVKIEKRKREWAQLFTEKPVENSEDPQDVKAISDASENIGDLKLKSAKDFTAPKHLRMNAEKKRAELSALEEKIHEKKTAMNEQILALRDTKVRLVSEVHAQAQRLQRVQRHLASHFHHPTPTLPTMLPEETPERRLQYSRTTLERYRDLKNNRVTAVKMQEDQDVAMTLLEQLEKEMVGEEEKRGREAEEVQERREEEALDSSAAREGDTEEEEIEKLTNFEEEVWKEKEIRLLHEEGWLLEQMEAAVLRFDSKLLLLRHEKLQMDGQLKLADLRHLTLVEELLLIKDFEKTEESLQEKLNERMEEENNVMCKTETYNGQLEVKQREIVRLQEQEKSLMASFRALLGDNNKFADLLTRVFKKKIKRVKKKEQTAMEGEQKDSDEDSDSDDWDVDNIDDDEDDDSISENGGKPLDDSICPPECNPELFENILQFREHRLDLEEQLVEERKCAEVLTKDRDALIKTEKVVQSSRKAAESDLELINKEKQQKMNELDVVVPLRLHQIEFLTNGSVPKDLSSALVLDWTELNRLQERIKELQIEKSQQRDLYCQARQQHVQVRHDHKDMKDNIQVLRENCNQVMMLRFGQLVDLEALQTLSGNRTLEELKQDVVLREAAYDKEFQLWEMKVAEARQALLEVTRCNTELLLCMTNFIIQKKKLEDKIQARQRKIGRQFQDSRKLVDQEDIQKLLDFVKTQAQQAEVLKTEISFLSRKGGHILSLGQALLPPFVPLPTPTCVNHTDNPGHPSSQHKVQFSTSSQGPN
ncbi:cilia- and flagella-associated protein 44 [Genypterus blacodes]|uniref:cilia- and flagella-associated protein 44 n=1 Tax=Genypterus blacodes TaxID=154954 RepID=UPI003F774E75